VCCSHAVDILAVVFFSNAVNLLTQIPKESYEELLTPINEVTSLSAKNFVCSEVEYDGKSMEAILTLLNFLDKRLETVTVLITVSVIFHCLNIGAISRYFVSHGDDSMVFEIVLFNK